MAKRRPQHKKRHSSHPQHSHKPHTPRAKVGEGIFSGTKSGYGFVTLPGEERDIFIPGDKTYGAIDGDRVTIQYHIYQSAYGKKTEGVVTNIWSLLAKRW